jgi:hypothetical protein
MFIRSPIGWNQTAKRTSSQTQAAQNPPTEYQTTQTTVTTPAMAIPGPSRRRDARREARHLAKSST